MRQVVDKYLVQDRSSEKVYETPQFMYMMIALTIFQEYPKETRLSYVKRYYGAISKHRLNIPTPIMAGVNSTSTVRYCVLIDADDTLDSIFGSDMGDWAAMLLAVGIGIMEAESVASTLKSEVEKSRHCVVPFLKKFESTVRCCTQNGIRGGSATVHFPICTKKSKTSSSSRTTKEPKTTV